MCSTVQVLQHHFPIQIQYYVYISRSALAAYLILHLNSSLRHDGSAGDAVLTFVHHVHPACNKQNHQNISDSRSQKLFVWSSKLFVTRPRNSIPIFCFLSRFWIFVCLNFKPEPCQTCKFSVVLSCRYGKQTKDYCYRFCHWQCPNQLTCGHTVPLKQSWWTIETH